MRAVVCVPICPLHVRPQADAPLADEALCGWPLELLEQPCPGWFRVRTRYRYEGFAPAWALTVGEGGAARWAEREKRLVWKAAADVLDRPAVQGCVMTTLLRGCLAAPLGEAEEGWQELALPDGRTGYTKRDFLEEYYETAPPIDPAALRRRVADAALAYLGVQYRWGGKSSLGLDCSGLTFMAWFANGVLLYRDAQIVPGFPVREIPRETMDVADLLFFPGHVALYLGGGRYLHSTARAGSSGVVINSLDPLAPDYRSDLAQSLTAVGSVFPLEE